MICATRDSSILGKTALPTPVADGCTLRPTSVNILMECAEGTWAAYTIMSPSRTAMFAVSPNSPTSFCRCGRTMSPICRPASSPRRISVGPSAYPRSCNCLAQPRLTSVRSKRWIVGMGKSARSASSLSVAWPPASAIKPKSVNARSTDCTPVFAGFGGVEMLFCCASIMPPSSLLISRHLRRGDVRHITLERERRLPLAEMNVIGDTVFHIANTTFHHTELSPFERGANYGCPKPRLFDYGASLDTGKLHCHLGRHQCRC